MWQGCGLSDFFLVGGSGKSSESGTFAQRLESGKGREFESKSLLQAGLEKGRQF